MRRAADAAAFASAPGVGACYAKMLNGCACATRANGTRVACGDRWERVDAGFVARAGGRVDALGFVGLLEAYNASRCLFHRRFGGAPRAFPVDRSHAQRDSPWPEAELRGWVDDADERVWARVLARFEADVARELARDARV